MIQTDKYTLRYKVAAQLNKVCNGQTDGHTHKDNLRVAALPNIWYLMMNDFVNDIYLVLYIFLAAKLIYKLYVLFCLSVILFIDPFSLVILKLEIQGS